MKDLNAQRMVAIVGGPEFIVPAGGWNSRLFVLKGVSLIKTMHRTATIVRNQAANRMARSVQRTIVDFADEVLARARGKADFSGLWQEAISEALKQFEGETRKALGREIQSIMGQGYSKTSLMLGTRPSAAGEAQRTKRARKISEETEAIQETTGKELLRVAVRLKDEGYSDADMRPLIREMTGERAKVRGRVVGRTVANEAWHAGSLGAMREGRVTEVSVIGCMSREEELWGKSYYADFLFDADGRSPESSCNIKDVPIEFADELNFHPNHSGTVVASAFEDRDDINADLL